MITEAIILAGGLGTRLRNAVPELPKCMAPVNGKPFIAYVTEYLQQHGIENFIFGLGYKSEAFESFLSSLPVSYQLSVEDEPLGTGGAIRKACGLAKQQDVLVTNGDTLFHIDPDELSSFHYAHKADCTICLKPMQEFDRYGVVELEKDSGKIISFKEKKHYASGMINGGVYALNKDIFLREELPEKFSFEKDYLEKYFDKRKMFGLLQEAYFIDIGIPEDYARAGMELQ